jgi:hypothetical protein
MPFLSYTFTYVMMQKCITTFAFSQLPLKEMYKTRTLIFSTIVAISGNIYVLCTKFPSSIIIILQHEWFAFSVSLLS